MEPSSISVAYLRETLGISRERMGRLLDVSARTIQRWEDNKQLPSNRWVTNVLIQLNDIVTLGLDVFSPEGLRIVMTEPQPAFGDKSGLEKIEAGEGQDVYSEFAGAYEGYIGT
jgi:transcriptional regulator with XRE-family HTH domain